MLGNGKQLFLVTQNRDSLKVFSRAGDKSIVQEDIVSPNSLTDFAIIALKNGKKRKHEFYYGSGYLSSSSRTLAKDASMSTIMTKDK